MPHSRTIVFWVDIRWCDVFVKTFHLKVLEKRKLNSLLEV